MKKINFALLLSVLVTTILQAITTPSKVTNVVLYRNGALIQREAAMELNPGIHTVVFVGLPKYIDENSITLKGKGDFLLKSVNFKNNHLANSTLNDEQKSLKEKIERLENKINVEKLDCTILDDELNMILANNRIGGEDGLNPDDLVKLSQFYSSRVAELRKLLFAKNKTIGVDNKELMKLKMQFQEIGNNNANLTGEIWCEIETKKQEKIHLYPSYIYNNAGWTTSYDLRVAEIDSDIELHTKAMIYQKSGEDWNSVHLTLSTGNPQYSTRPVEFMPWIVNFINPYQKGGIPGGNMAVQVRGYKEANMRKLDEAAADMVDFEYAAASENITVMEFDLKDQVSVPTNQDNFIIYIETQHLETQYEYSCTPKTDPNVYLMARIPNWENYRLMQGKASLFFQDSYIGSSYINTTIPDDTMAISLGRDIGVTIERKRVKDYETKSFFGNRTSEDYKYSFHIRNNKSTSISLTLYDQIPISAHEDIDVVVKNLNDGSLNKDSGKVQWKDIIPSGQSKKHELSFTIKYPTNKTINK